MAIATRSKKALPASRATIAPAASPAERRTAKRPGKSPHTNNVNAFLADINRPMTYTDSVLQVLQPRYSTPEDDPKANSEKGRQMDAPDSPTGVDDQASTPSALDEAVPPEDTNTALATQPPKSNRSVTISETATTGIPAGGVSQGTAASPNITVRQSILLSSAKNVGSTKDPEDDSGYTPTEDRPQEILDKEQKLYQVYTDDGLKETAYHVVDFAGFYPI
jgi:hypothetical protein